MKDRQTEDHIGQIADCIDAVASMAKFLVRFPPHAGWRQDLDILHLHRVKTPYARIGPGRSDVMRAGTSAHDLMAFDQAARKALAIAERFESLLRSIPALNSDALHFEIMANQKNGNLCIKTVINEIPQSQGGVAPRKARHRLVKALSRLASLDLPQADRLFQVNNYMVPAADPESAMTTLWALSTHRDMTSHLSSGSLEIREQLDSTSIGRRARETIDALPSSARFA